MLTWWTIPLPGGTTRRFEKACSAHRANRYRSALRSYSIARLTENASGVPATSTCSEWSITRSFGTSGSTTAGSPPQRCRLVRMAASPISAGTPVKSCRIKRSGRNDHRPPRRHRVGPRGQGGDVGFGGVARAGLAQ